MPSKLFPRLLGVLGIHAVISGLLWIIVKFALATQDGLSPDLTERLDGDPVRIQSHLDEVTSEMLLTGIGGLLVSALLACLWLFLIDRNPPYGDKSARSKRGSWAGLMILAVIAAVALFWFMLIGAPIAEMLAPNVPLKTTILGIVLLVVGYWFSTGLFAPASTKVAVPGTGLFGA